MNNIYKELHQKNLIDHKQFHFLDAIRTNKIISLYYELRTILYLGVLLFTGGIGYLAYQNIGSIGHIACLFLIAGIIGVGVYYCNKFSKPYTHQQIKVQHNYLDYILLLVALLLITLFTYILVYFNLLESLNSWTSAISTILFFTMAYRYDNKALLAMGITALATTVGISITPINWLKGEWLLSGHLYVTGILLGISLYALGVVSSYKDIKKHFKFTYVNFGYILYYVSSITAIFNSSTPTYYAIITFIATLIISYNTWKSKEFLFFLYANLAGYIAFTYLVIQALDAINGGFMFYIYYFPVSCISYVAFLINKKSHFVHA
ncbi:hypothetical protein N9901_00210 [Flavobacteriaceae bacterium]|nr:hypothetical protein [Flavobacteriaceae bacterium]